MGKQGAEVGVLRFTHRTVVYQALDEEESKERRTPRAGSSHHRQRSESRCRQRQRRCYVSRHRHAPPLHHPVTQGLSLSHRVTTSVKPRRWVLCSRVCRTWCRPSSLSRREGAEHRPLPLRCRSSTLLQPHLLRLILRGRSWNPERRPNVVSGFLPFATPSPSARDSPFAPSQP
jgi:hypothetical protein